MSQQSPTNDDANPLCGCQVQMSSADVKNVKLFQHILKIHIFIIFLFFFFFFWIQHGKCIQHVQCITIQLSRSCKRLYRYPHNPQSFQVTYLHPVFINMTYKEDSLSFNSSNFLVSCEHLPLLVLSRSIRCWGPGVLKFRLNVWPKVLTITLYTKTREDANLQKHSFLKGPYWISTFYHVNWDT